jgi:hypothetical protein
MRFFAPELIVAVGCDFRWRVYESDGLTERVEVPEYGRGRLCARDVDSQLHRLESDVERCSGTVVWVKAVEGNR